MNRRDVAILVVFALLFMLTAHVGSNTSERAHRALDAQYRQCEHRYGFGGEGFPECLHGK